MKRNDPLHKSRRQEADLADKYRGSRNVMSGAGWLRKADVRTDRYLIEAKTTDRESYSLKLKELRTLRKQALLDGRRPLFVVDISGHRYMVMEADDFEEMDAGLIDG